MNRPPDETDPAERGRRQVREIISTLALAIGLLGATLVTTVVAGHDVAVVAGTVAFAVMCLIGFVVARRSHAVLAARNRIIQRERLSREQLERTLAATRRLVETESPIEVRRRICEVARDVFGCSAVSLWAVEGDHMLLLERVPWEHPYSTGERRAITDLPGLREAFESTRPLFVDDLRATATGLTQATAEIVGTRSLLNVPIAQGGVTRLSLVFTFDDVLPGIGDAVVTAAQRFADQAALALEQVRYRAAQAEIASLNRTLQRMVQSDPLFHAGGSVAEVARAICDEALSIFEADAAALWIDVGDAIELVRRVPTARIFAPRTRIPFTEHPDFGEDLGAGVPRFVADVEHEDPVLWERFARHSLSRSQLRLPLASGGGARALIVLSWQQPVAPPSAELSALASRFADQAGVALAEAARREAREEAAALHARLEESLLPSIELHAPHAAVATFYRPGDERLTLGGDFYDCLQTADGSVAVLIGDVAGHGPAAAALGASLRSAWRALTLGNWSLADLPRGLQDVCVSERHDPYAFVTALLGVIDPGGGSLRYVSAGHPPPELVGGPELAAANGPPLGVVGNARWTVEQVALPERCTVVLYTDGLIEGRASPGSRERLGIAPIRSLLAGATPGALGGADLEALVQLASEANGAGLPDDVALLAVNLTR